MFVRVRGRPAGVHVLGLARLALSNLSHGVHSDRSCTRAGREAGAYFARLRAGPRGPPAALRWSAMTENPPDIPLGSWLADLPDERLITLLQLRPDLAQPPPGSIAALRARGAAPQS